MKTLELRSDINPREVARRLVSICGGKMEAISTLVDGGRSLPTYANLLYNVSQEIYCVRETSQDVYRVISTRRGRKGGSPRDRRYL